MVSVIATRDVAKSEDATTRGATVTPRGHLLDCFITAATLTISALQ
jgi:hypothetical protein